MSDPSQDQGFRAHDIAAAFSLLTIFPIPVDHEQAGARAAHAVWAYPLVGAALGAIAASIGNLALVFGAPTGLAAALALGVLALSTGAMHEDGLADCADGLGGGRDKVRRLEIMKDSRIGAFGAVALMVALLARFSGIEALMAANTLFWPLVAVGAASRLPMVLAMFLMSSARDNGLSASVGLPPPKSVVAAIGATFVICVLTLGWGVIPMLFWVGAATLPLFWLAGRLIGGQTGDVLGGAQQLAEIAALGVAFAAVT
ncbi:MAG: adenosylcobinamide-GDP ribazoletransferase [Alphaproteobacteria bacterium]|nr:adenosylcobinamide-GDP ribazoletransferase [Alphaproteobacteria bacterium]